MRMMIFYFCLFFGHTSVAQIDIATDREIFERERARLQEEGARYRIEDYIEETNTPLSSRYFKGSVLMYDCKDRHFVCTSMLNAIECRDMRDHLLNNERFFLPCVPIKRFKTDDECVKEQYRRMHEIPDLRWCYNSKKLSF